MTLRNDSPKRQPETTARNDSPKQQRAMTARDPATLSSCGLSGGVAPVADGSVYFDQPNRMGMLRIRISIWLLAVLILAPAARAQSSDRGFSGSLDASLARRSNGAPYMEHTFDVQGARQIVVRMTSSDFDTVLILRSPSGVETTNDDYEGSQSVSQLTEWASEPGQWVIRASSYAEGGYGDYSVDVALGDEVRFAEVEGRLEPQDEQMVKGERVDVYPISIDGNDRLVVELFSMGFDGFLSIQLPDGRYERNDDAVAENTTLARVGPLVGAGEYQVYVTSVGAGLYGAYDLRFIRTDPGYVPPELAPVSLGPPIEAGMRVVRGPDWKWEDQDGNSAGTVTGPATDAGWWQVDWDDAEANIYRWGVSGAYDLAIISPVDPQAVTAGDMVRVRADVAEFEDVDADVVAQAGNKLEVESVESDGLVIRLPGGRSALVATDIIELVYGG